MPKTVEQLADLSPQEQRALLARLVRKKTQKPKLARLSLLQLPLWFLYQMDPESASYNLPAAARLSGRLDVEVLQRSINEVVRSTS